MALTNIPTLQVLTGDFTEAVKQVLAKRTGFRCSNPQCRKPTMGPHSIQPDSFVYVGQCAHICANQPKGERYDAQQTMEMRGGVANAIHLCLTCHAIIDMQGAAAKGYTVAMLHEWKQRAETQAEISLLRGENSESAMGALHAEVKMLTLQLANLQQSLNNVTAATAAATATEQAAEDDGEEQDAEDGVEQAEVEMS